MSSEDIVINKLFEKMTWQWTLCCSLPFWWQQWLLYRMIMTIIKLAKNNTCLSSFDFFARRKCRNGNLFLLLFLFMSFCCLRDVIHNNSIIKKTEKKKTPPQATLNFYVMVSTFLALLFLHNRVNKISNRKCYLKSC